MTTSPEKPLVNWPFFNARMTLATVALLLISNSAFGIGLNLTQIGGTAVNGQGVVGDTVEVAVDFTIGENEVTTGVFPTLWWDQDGGNVLDIVSATEGFGGFLGPYLMSPLNRTNYILTDSSSPVPTDRNDRFFSNSGVAFGDTQVGTTLMIGFEAAIPALSDDQLLAEIINNGLPGPASFRLGVVTFQLASLGETTLALFRDPNSTLRTLITGPRGITFTNDDITFTDIPISGIGFGSLQIMVIPEPSTAMLLIFGLFGLAARRPAQ